MNFKTTYILFGVLAGLLLIFGLSQMLGTKPGEQGYLLADLHKAGVTADAIDTVEIQRTRPAEEKLVFIRDSTTKRWRMLQPYPARADSEAVNRLVRDLVNVRRDEKANVVADPAKYGLAPPAEVVTLKQGAEREWAVQLGDESAGGPSSALVYAATIADPKYPTAVKRVDVESALKPVRDFRSKDLLAEGADFGAAARLQSIKLQEAGKAPVVLKKSAEERWQLAEPPLGDADYEGEPAAAAPATGPKRVTGVRELTTDLDNLRVESADDFVADNATDMAKYGLAADKPERLRIEVTRKPAPPVGGGEAAKEPEPRVLLVGKKADDKGDKLYARLEDDTNVVRIPAKSVEPIAQVAADPAALRNRDLAQFDASRADAVDIQGPAGAVTLRKPAALWQLYQAGKPRKAENSAVLDLLTALTARRQVQSFPAPAKEGELGFDKPQAVVSVWVDGLQKEEKKEERPADKKDEKKPAEAEPKLKDPKPTVKLIFGRKEGNVVYVRRETASDKAVLAVPDSLLAKVDQGPWAYIDRTLPSFPETADVTGLTVERAGETFEADKTTDKTPAVWTLKRPKDLAGRKADATNAERIVAELRGLHTDKIVAEDPKADALAQYGLQAPSVKAAVRVLNKETKKPEDWAYLFGNETPDKSGRYAKVAQSDLVFVASPAVLDALNAELQDPTVFHFDAAKAKAVKLAGWKQATGFTFTLDAERKADKGWTAKTPPDFDLDAEQVESLVRALADLKAVRFVSRTGPPKPEAKLGPNDRSLQIDVSVDGEKTPLTLTLGALDTKDKGYYAQASTLPGYVFLAPQEPVERLLTSPKALTRGAPPAK